MTDTTVHHLATEFTVDRKQCRRACPCGYTTDWWHVVPGHRNLTSNPDGCPRDDTVRALTTLQFSSGGLFDGRPVDGYAAHLVRSTNHGTPGPTLCGLDRFAPDSAGWSVGGGISGPGIVHTPCPGCVATARHDFPGLPIRGSVGANEMTAAVDG